MNRKTTNRLLLYRLLWCRIRYYQQLYDISDDALANALGVHKRTLKEYDKSAENVTFGKLSSLLYKRSDCTLIHGIKKPVRCIFIKIIWDGMSSLYSVKFTTLFECFPESFK